MRSKSDDILTTFGLTTDNSKKYDVAKDKFDGYFVKRRNIIFEREKFHRSKQETGEPVDFLLTYVALPNIVNLVCYRTKWSVTVLWSV